MRAALGWIVGFVAAFIITSTLNMGMAELGIPTHIDFGEAITVTHGGGRGSYDTEESRASTAAGEAIVFAGMVLGIWLGRFVAVWPKSPLFDVQTRSWGAGFLVFLLAYGVGGAILLLMFGDVDAWYTRILFNVVQLAVCVGAFLLGRKQFLRVSGSTEAVIPWLTK